MRHLWDQGGFAAAPGIVLAVLAAAACAVAAADTASAAGPAIRAFEDPRSGQIEIVQGDQPVLRYNYRTVEPPEGYLDKVHAGARRYARARSDYIHPLYGPDGERLTDDWSPDHPHHRGIYWAWPEVDYRGQRGDLHALQRVFARPTGKIELQSGDGFAQVEAENLWKWEDETPIVRETAVIRAHRAGEHGRYVDLTFRFAALEDGVAIARRGTDHYGGLNIRLAPVAEHQVVLHTDPPGAEPRRNWGDSLGARPGGKGPVGLAVFQHAANPGYPGQWIQYPALPWFQPTFPPTGTRYVLEKDRPLVLKYRLWIRRGGALSPEEYARRWDEYNK